jgi:hypothetical protein
MADLPTIVTTAGLQPRDIEEIRNSLLTQVASTNPGYTANLPGILIEDISSTDTLAIAQCDSARVETVNSLTPLGANAFLLLELGQMLGVPVGSTSFTSVFVTFQGPAGFVLGKGFIVTDGLFQYALNDGGIIGSDGFSLPLFAIATQGGTWAVPAGSVNKLVTSIPSGITVTVNNLQGGIPGSTVGLTESDYRGRVMRANLAASQGMARYLRTLLANVPGVQTRLILPLMNPVVGTQGWEMIVGGGDPYQVAYAIYTALFDISTIVGSTLDISGITQALPAMVSTRLNHLLPVGQAIHIADTNPSAYEGDFVVMSVPSEKTFTLGKPFPLDAITAASWAATGGGQVTYTTTTAHGVTVGSTFVIAGMVPTGYNGSFTAIAGTTGSTLKAAMVSDPGAETTLGQLQPGNALWDSTGLAAWVSGGVITPNPRNVQVSIQDSPDTYSFPIVIPPQQSVTIAVTWSTISPNFVAPVAIAQAVQPAIVDYINSIIVGQPISLIELEEAFVTAVQPLLMVELISNLDFDISINGVATAPTGLLVFGDPESFFFAQLSDIVVTKV